jgi:hypothetical protein
MTVLDPTSWYVDLSDISNGLKIDAGAVSAIKKEVSLGLSVCPWEPEFPENQVMCVSLYQRTGIARA